MSRIIRYIDARVALERPAPAEPLPSDEAWQRELLGYWVILGLLLTAVALVWVWT